MVRKRFRIISVVAVVGLLLGIFAVSAYAYFNRGTLQISVDKDNVTLTAGQTANVTVTATPAQDSQLPGCGLEQCPQTCPSYCVQEAVYGNNCTCNGTTFQNYNTTVTASSSDNGVATATVNGMQVSIKGVASGTAIITVTGNLREWTAAEKQIQVTVTSASASSSGGGGGGGSAASSKPSIETKDATSTTATSAVLNGNITSNNGYNVTDYGFLWWTSSSNLNNKLDVGTNNQSGVFTTTLSDLKASTTYYFQAYATNSQGTTQGTTLKFTTASSAGQQPAKPTTTSQATAPTTTTQGAEAVSYSDVPVSYWAYNAINYLSSKGMVSGYPDGTFKPDASVTRAEFTAMLVKALRLSATGTTGAFTDIAPDSWCYNAVNEATAAGLVSGTGGHLFDPNAPVTREQMAGMVANALGAKASSVDGTELNPFSDKSNVSTWALTSMEQAVKAGIVSGVSADTIAPHANATRAQATAIIYKMLGILDK